MKGVRIHTVGASVACMPHYALVMSRSTRQTGERELWECNWHKIHSLQNVLCIAATLIPRTAAEISVVAEDDPAVRYLHICNRHY